MWVASITSASRVHKAATEVCVINFDKFSCWSEASAGQQVHRSRCWTGAGGAAETIANVVLAVAVDAADDDIRRVSQRGCDLSKAYPLPTRHTHTHTQREREIEIHIYYVYSICSTCRATSSWSPSSGNDFGSSCARFASLPPFSFLVTFYVFPSPLAAYLSHHPLPFPPLAAA